MPGVLLQYHRCRGMALTVALQEPETPQWNKLHRAQIALSSRRHMPAASVIHTCGLVLLKPPGGKQEELCKTPQILTCQHEVSIKVINGLFIFYG